MLNILDVDIGSLGLVQEEFIACEQGRDTALKLTKQNLPPLAAAATDSSQQTETPLQKRPRDDKDTTHPSSPPPHNRPLLYEPDSCFITVDQIPEIMLPSSAGSVQDKHRAVAILTCAGHSVCAMCYGPGRYYHVF